MSNVKIIGLQAENVKRIQAVNLEFNENGLTVIGGDNGEGKTSILDSICYLLGGEKYRPSALKHDGAITDPYLSITLSNGLVVTRKGKNSSLIVSDPSGKQAGQTLLNSFVSSFSLSLDDFMNAKPKEKSKILLGVLGLNDKINALDEAEKKLFDERTIKGRIVDQKKGFADEQAWYPNLPEHETKLIDLLNERQKIMDENISRQQGIDGLNCRKYVYQHEIEGIESLNQEINNKKIIFESIISEISKLQNELDNFEKIPETEDILKIDKEIACLEARKKETIKKNVEIEQQKIKLEGIRSAHKASMTMLDDEKSNMQILMEKHRKADNVIIEMKKQIDFFAQTVITDMLPTAEIDEKIANVEKVNDQIRQNQKKKDAIAEYQSISAEYDALTAKIEKIRAEVMELLNGAPMPLKQLSIDSDTKELLYNQQKWDCMSGAEKLIVATSIAKSLKPECGFVLIDGIEQMDIKTLEKFSNWLKSQNIQAIATRVSKGDECQIIIENGTILKNNNITENLI